jgi:hypothetical protein
VKGKRRRKKVLKRSGKSEIKSVTLKQMQNGLKIGPQGKTVEPIAGGVKIIFFLGGGGQRCNY